MMKKFEQAVLMAGVAVMMSGCSTTQRFFDGTVFAAESDPDTDTARVASNAQQISLEYRQISEQMMELRQNQQEMDQRLTRIESQVGSGGRTQDDITALRRDIQLLRAEKEALRKEITDDLAGRVEKIAAKTVTGSSPSRTASGSTAKKTGYEHKVVKGQTLSEIARGYGKSVDSIMKANKITNPASIRIGQVLFIPD